MNIIENNNWYKPHKDDLAIGMEYEFLQTDAPEYGWTPSVIKCGTQIDDITRTNKDDSSVYEIRVKHLDEFDAQDLGWNLVHNAGGENEIKIHSYLNMVKGDKMWNLIIIYPSRKCEIQDSFTHRMMFNGTIENKCELKKVMTQLGINIALK